MATQKEINRFLEPKSSLKDQINSILENITTLHGTNHLLQKRGNTWRLWVLLMTLNAIWMISFILVINKRYNSEDIVTEISADYKVHDVPFPTVSICNFNLVSYSETSTIANILKYHKRPKKEIQAFFKDLQKLNVYGVSTRDVGNFSEIMKILKEHYFDMGNIMEGLHQKCENLMVYCEFNSKQKKCEDIFHLIQTFQGHCCAFNYAAINDDIDNPLLPPDKDFEYYYDESISETTGVITTAQSGSSSGLRVVFNVQPHDYPPWSIVRAYGATVIINDPIDYPETTLDYRYISMGESLHLKVAPLVYRSDDILRSLPPEKRGCWFHDEVSLRYTDRYSYETCHTECKMNNYFQSCGCIPYKYPISKSVRVCEIEDLPCLNNMTVHSTRQLPCKPYCYLNCNDKTYSLTTDTMPFMGNRYPPEIGQEHNISELIALQVYFGQPTCTCYQSTMLNDFTHLVASYGGILPLTFGGSLITLVELAYLLLSALARLAWRRAVDFIRRRNRVQVNIF